MMSEEIRFTIKEGIATVTINRPEKRNALNTAVLEGLEHCFHRLEADPNVRVVVIRGEGKAFCSGVDLRELSLHQGSDDPEAMVLRVLQQIERSRHPTIAMVHGDAFAGGCVLALHCDLRVASDAARFAMPLARLGLVVPFPLVLKLVETIGSAFTKELLFAGAPMDARRAYEIGMLHQLVPAGELEGATYALARTIADNAPLSLASMKAAILRSISLRETISHRDLDEMVDRARKSADAREGIRAMLEKCRPAFRGE
jgi:enoyl-CoA hydratase/carnithine racemase